MRRITEKIDSKILKILTSLNREELTSFVNELAQSQVEYKITEEQLKTLKIFFDEDYITFKENFLRLPSLYEADRQGSVKNFAYTVRILSIVNDDQQLSDLYKSNKANTEQVNQLKAEIKKALDPNLNNNYVFSTSKIKEIVNGFDNRYKKLSKIKDEQEIKDDWSNLTQDIERLAARVYELFKNDRQREIFDGVNNKEVVTIIHTLYQSAVNAMGDSKDKAPTSIYFDNDFKAKVNTALTSAENQDKSFDVSKLMAQNIINLFRSEMTQSNALSAKRQAPKVVYKSKSGGVKDEQGQPILIYDKDGNALKLGEIEVEHYVGNSV